MNTFSSTTTRPQRIAVGSTKALGWIRPYYRTPEDTNPLAKRAFPSHVPAAMDDKIAQFCQVTGCVDPAKAKFFLESSNGEIDAAISAFFGAPRPSVSPEISHP